MAKDILTIFVFWFGLCFFAFIMIGTAVFITDTISKVFSVGTLHAVTAFAVFMAGTITISGVVGMAGKR